MVALEGLGGWAVVDALERALGDPDAQVRWQAARGLGEAGDARVVPPLRALEDDADVRVRQVVASSLRKLGARAGPHLPEPGPNRHILQVYADYHQFYIHDVSFTGDTGDPSFWSPEAFARRLAISPPSLVGISTDRYDEVPVVLEITDRPPGGEFASWDHVVEASLAIPTGRLAIRGPTSTEGDSLELPPGTYRLRIFSAGLDTFDEDWYRSVLWPQAKYEQAQVVRAYPTGDQPGPR